MDDSKSCQWLQVWGLFLQTHARLVQRLDEEMVANEGIPLSWFDVLLQLSFVPDGQRRMHDLLPSLRLTRSGLTRRIDRMEAAGLVRRTGCADDARGVVVALTSHGRDRLRDVAPAHARRIQTDFAEHVTNEELHAMGNALRRILLALSTDGEGGKA